MSKKPGKSGDDSSSSKKPSDIRSLFKNFTAATKSKMSTTNPSQQTSPMKRKAVVLSDDSDEEEGMKSKKLNNGTSNNNKKFSALSTKSSLSSLSSLSRKKALSQQIATVVDLLDTTDITAGKSSSSSSDSSSRIKTIETSNSAKPKSNGIVKSSSSSNLATKSSNGFKSLSLKSKKEQTNKSDNNNSNNTNKNSSNTNISTTTKNNGGGHDQNKINKDINTSKRSSFVISSYSSSDDDEESLPPKKKKHLEPSQSKMSTTTTSATTKSITNAQNENMDESLFEKSYILTPLPSFHSTPSCDLNSLNDNTKNKTPPRAPSTPQSEPWQNFHDFDSDLETPPQKSRTNKKEQDNKQNEMVSQVSSSSVMDPPILQNKNITKFQNNDDKMEKSKVTVLGSKKPNNNNIDNKSSSLNTSFSSSLVNLPTPKSEPKSVLSSSSRKQAAKKHLEFNDNNSPTTSSTSSLPSTVPKTSSTSSLPSTVPKTSSTSSLPSTVPSTNNSTATTTTPSLLLPKDLLWVDKYKPTKLKSVIGQGGNNSCAKNLFQWLQNWFKYHGSSTDKARTRYPGMKDPEGKIFKVALLSGPPGIGKTTTAHLACKELGYTFTELNASDKRNKNSFQDSIRDQLGNWECLSYFGQDINSDDSSSTSNFATSSDKQQKYKKTMKRRHVLIMDEVDGVSGNEDRGGIQELINLIKKSRIPIICICNDRQSQKIRSLANYCHDLRFDQPNSTQLKGLIQQICFKEKIKVPPPVQEQLISSTNQDVRQIIHHLQLAKGTQINENIDQVYNPQKNITLGPWEVVKKVFSAQDHVNMSISDKASLFFHDYNIGPLFVQENYLKCTPIAAKGNRFKTMDLLKATAQSLAYGDVVESMIRKSQNWNLLPTQCIFQSVLPGEYMECMKVGRLDFPTWLGKNSNTTKRQRLLREIHSHAHLKISGSLEALNMDYVPHFKRKILQPLLQNNVEDAVSFMTDYTFLRDDFDSIDELCFPDKGLKYENVPATTKNSFTRTVNKKLFLPYSVDSVIKKRRGTGINESETMDEENLYDIDGENGVYDSEDDSKSEDNNFEKDKMIKMKISTGKKTSGKTKTTTASTKKDGSSTKLKKAPTKGKM